jgi:hypothetical protein
MVREQEERSDWSKSRDFIDVMKWKIHQETFPVKNMEAEEEDEDDENHIENRANIIRVWDDNFKGVSNVYYEYDFFFQFLLMKR